MRTAAARGSWPATARWASAGDDGSTQERPVRDAGPDGPSPGVRISNGSDWLRVSAGGFFQGHAGMRARLAAALADAAGAGDGCLELFAGAGFFTLLLAARFRRLVAVEGSPGAVADLRGNLAAAGRTGVEVRPQSVEQALRDPALRGGFEVVVLDPPRVGLGRQAAEDLAGLGARRLVYLSCDPATLARDLAILVARGYRLARVAGFDLFPQTPHVEALAVLEPSGDAVRAR
jgi:tRNA/tmRNA/rRNA uracil-C5-methylase (TrmA/RlmC/RlmD family)